MNDVGHVGVLRLRCGTVCGDMEVSRDLEKKENKPSGSLILFKLVPDNF